MKEPTTPSAISLIETKIAEHRELNDDFARDQTLDLARRELEAAKAVKESADREDPAVDAEELVDRRMEAQRQIDIATIKLDRAQKAIGARGWRVLEPLREAAKLADPALRDAAEVRKQQLDAGVTALFGEEVALRERRHFESISYGICNRYYAAARSLTTAASGSDSATELIGHLNRSIDLLKQAGKS